MSSQSTQQTDRPRMIRERPGDIGQNNCANFYYARKEITEKDATQEIDLDIPATQKESLTRMSDTILNNKHHLIYILNKHLKVSMKKAIPFKDDANSKFFDPEGPFILSNNKQITEFINSTLDNNDIKTFTHEHFNTSLHSIQAGIQAEINKIMRA